MPLSRIRLELETRFSLLLLHGLMGFAGGLLILFFGLGTALARLPDGRLTLGLLGLVSGAVAHYGTVTRRPRAQLVGMVAVSAWYAAAAGGYLYVMLKAPGPAMSWPWDPSVNPVSPYPLVLFTGLALLAVRHVVTLLRLRSLP